MKQVDPQLVLWAAIAVAAVYVVYQGKKAVSGAAGAIGDAASAAGSAVKTAGGYAVDVLTGKEDPIGDLIGFHIGGTAPAPIDKNAKDWAPATQAVGQPGSFAGGVLSNPVTTRGAVSWTDAPPIF